MGNSSCCGKSPDHKYQALFNFKVVYNLKPSAKNTKASLKEQPTVELIEEASSKEREATQDFSDIDKKKLLRMFDLRLMPLFTILYLMPFLDEETLEMQD